MSDETEWCRTEREVFSGALARIILEHADEIDRAYVAFVRVVRDVAVAAKNSWDTVERRHREELKRRALALRPRWRKADVRRSLLLGIGGKRADQLYMAKLLEGEGPRGGRGAVPEPKTVAEEIVELVRFGEKIVAPATPPHIRRAMYQKMPWWPHLIEAAYRGELRKARTSRRGVTVNERHGATASEIADKRVADAATISPGKVHALCQRVRNERGSDEPDDPEMTAAELKRHLEEGPPVTVS